MKLNKMQSQVEAQLQKANDTLYSLQDTYDNRSEKWQESEKGEQMLERIGNLEDLVLALEEALDNFNQE